MYSRIKGSLYSWNLIIPILLLWAATSAAQVPTPIRTVTTLPATCNGGTTGISTDKVVVVTGTVGIEYTCTASNIWTPSSSLRPQVTPSSTGSDACAKILGVANANPSTGGPVDAYGLGGTINQPCAANSFPAVRPTALYLGTNVFQIANGGGWVMVQGDTLKGITWATPGPGSGVTLLQAASGFSGSLLTLNGSNNIHVEDLGFDCQNQTGCNGLTVNDSEENTHVRNVSFTNVPGTSLQIGNGSAGVAQNSGPYDEIIVNASIAGTCTAATRGIVVNANTNAMRTISNVTIDYRACSTPPTYCMTVNTTGQVLDNIHLEGCTGGIRVTAPNVVLRNISCQFSASTVQNCVILDTGSYNTSVCNVVGAPITNLVQDLVNSASFSAATYGQSFGCYQQPGTGAANMPFALGTTLWVETGTPNPFGKSGADVCYADSTSHAPLCSFNNQAVGQLLTTTNFPIPSKYNTLSVTGNGLNSVQASTGAVTIGSGSSIAATSLCSTTQCPAGRYRVDVYIDITTACTTTGSTIPWVAYTDDAGAKTGSATTTYFAGGGGLGVTPASSSAGLTLVPISTTDFLTGTYFLTTTGAATGGLGSINYGVTNTACGTGGPMVGKAYFDVTRLE